MTLWLLRVCTDHPLADSDSNRLGDVLAAAACPQLRREGDLTFVERLGAYVLKVSDFLSVKKISQKLIDGFLWSWLWFINPEVLFLPRGAIHSADYAVARSLTVARRDCVETAKHIIRRFHRHVATQFYLFFVPNFTVISRRPPSRDAECRRCEKPRFSTNISFYLGNDTRYGMRIGSVPRLSNGTILNDLEWPWVTYRRKYSMTRSIMWSLRQLSFISLTYWPINVNKMIDQSINHRYVCAFKRRRSTDVFRVVDILWRSWILRSSLSHAYLLPYWWWGWRAVE